MLDDGYYDATFGTILGVGRVRLRLEQGHVSGMTQRGTTLNGIVRFDEVRKLMRFDMAADMPAFFTALTGRATSATGRTARFTGAVNATPGGARFSVDFAGRAVNIEARYGGPLNTAR